MQALDGDAGVGADFELPAVGAVGGADDDAGVGNGGDGAVAGFDGAGEPVVEVAPAAAGLNVLFHVVGGGVPEGLDAGDGLWVVEPVTELLGVLVHPLCEPGILYVDGFGPDGVLEVFDGGLVHDEVEDADAVVDVAAVFALFGDPVEPFVDFGEVLVDGGDGLHFDDTAVMGALDGGIEAVLPS